MNISENYYTNWAKSELPNYFLYVSKSNDLISALDQQIPFKSFGHNLKEAKIEKGKYEQMGYSTLLYRTYGTSSSLLSNHLLSYSKESLAFIAFHEATHKHITRNGGKPYSIIEAVCDIVGNYGTLRLFNNQEGLSNRKAKKQIKQIEKISSLINDLINKNTNDVSQLNKEIKKLKKRRHKFKAERYDYEINNAYLLRNRSYTLHYFKLKKVLLLTNDLKAFLEFVDDLPNNEDESIKAIDEKIKLLKKSSS